MAANESNLAHIHNNMIAARTDHTDEPQVLWRITEGIVQAYGTTVPSDGTSGYVKGAMFFKSDGGYYINNGSESSALFEEYLTGDVTGDVTGEVTPVKQTLEADLDLEGGDFESNWIELDGSSATVNVTNWTPTPGRTYYLHCSDATSAVTISLSSGVTYNGTHDTATFAAGETLVLFSVSDTRLAVVGDPDSITLS